MAIPHETGTFKRRFPRRYLRRAIGLLINGDYFVGTGVEIGEGGMSLSVPTDLAIGKEAVVSFQLPEGSFLCVRIEVRSNQIDSVTGHLVTGCLFKNLKFDHKREIRAYVSARTEVEV